MVLLSIYHSAPFPGPTVIYFPKNLPSRPDLLMLRHKSGHYSHKIPKPPPKKCSLHNLSFKVSECPSRRLGELPGPTKKAFGLPGRDPAMVGIFGIPSAPGTPPRSAEAVPATARRAGGRGGEDENGLACLPWLGKFSCEKRLFNLKIMIFSCMKRAEQKK